MRAQLKALYDLQQVDLQIASLNKALASLDDGSTLCKQIAAGEKQLAVLLNDLRSKELELKESELNLQSVEARGADLRKRMYGGSISNPKELSSIEKEIEALDKNRSELDEQILTLYDAVEERQASVKKLESAILQAKTRLDRNMAEYNSKSEEQNGELATLFGERQKMTEAVTDKRLLQRYESIKSRHKDTGLAVVEGGKCGACHIGLTTYMQMQVEDNDQVSTCESCGRILFLDN